MKPVRSGRSAATLALCLALAVPAGVLAQAADIVVNMHEVELADVAEQISRLTGRTLILDPAVKGTVNVVSAEPLSAAGVWDLFQSVLRVHGFAAIRSGRAWRIVPQAAAVQGVPSSGGGGQVVTSMVRLRNLPSDIAARALKPLVASFGSLEAIPTPNAIVVTDYADNVRRIEALARSLDAGGGNAVDSISLRYGSAKAIATALQTLLGEQGGAGGARVAADERSNTLLVRGDARAIADARRLAAQLDRPGSTTPVTRMIRLKNAEAESLVDVLRGVMGVQSDTATNPVARSLSPGGDQATLGAGAIGQSTATSGSTSGSGSFGGGSFGSSTGGSYGSGTSTGSGSFGSGGVGIGPSGLPGATQAPPAFGSQQQANLNTGFSTPDLTVQAASDINAIILRGSPTAIAAVEPLIGQLDLRRPQVMIEAAIVEVTSDVGEQLGVQLGFGNAAAVGPSGGATSFTSQGVPLQGILSALGAPVASGLLANGVSGVIKPDNDFSILVQALSSSTKANLLSTPSITTLDNQPAEIVVAQNVPFKTGDYTTSVVGGVSPFTTIERQDVGITLKVIPRIHEGNVIRLDVSQEASSIASAVTDAVDLITNRRSIQTTVLADDGQTIVLGGLTSDDRMTTRSAVPVLGDIPVLGLLFRDKKEQQTKRTLFVFLKPTILRDPMAAAAAAERKYDRLRYDEYDLKRNPSLLLNPPRPRLTTEIRGIY